MSARRGRRAGLLLMSLPALALVVASLTPPASADPGGEPAKERPAAASTARVKAERALDRVERAFEGKAPRAEVTLALRDLLIRQDDLSPEGQEIAGRYLDRPTDPGGGVTQDPAYGRVPKGKTCGSRVCVHWVEKGPHKVAHDGNVKTVPTYVKKTLATLQSVAGTYVAAGYRPVKGDGTLGGNSKPDVYLAEIGSQGMYGYCTSDAQIPQGGPYNVWAFCVLDNDYKGFASNTPIENMQVTAAHEYLHAVQFGYDVFEDAWIMEATATWAEEQLFDGIDDNVQYLESGPLGRPDVPLDTFDSETGYQYGAWIFFQYLSDRLTESQGGMATVVRDIWALLDGAPGGTDMYSMGAVEAVLADRGTSLAEQFAGFADGNRRPATTYDEGEANGYPTAPEGDLGSQDSGGWWTVPLDHLTSSTLWLDQFGDSTSFVFQVDASALADGAVAVLSTYASDGSVDSQEIPLGGTGAGSVTVPVADAERFELTVVNTSTRMGSCWAQQTPWSCSGVPLDDDAAVRMRVGSII